MLLESRTFDHAGRAVGGKAASFEDILAASERAMRLVDSSFSRNLALEEAYDARIDAIFAATGQRHFNPMRYVPAFDEVSGVMDEADPHQLFQGWLDKLSAQYPDRGDIIRADRPIIEDARQLATEAEGQMGNVWARSDHGGIAWSARLVGGIYGMRLDPINWASMLVGPFGQAGRGAKGLLWMSLKVGAVNAGAEAAIQPFVQEWRKEAGLAHGLDQAAVNIAAAGLFGFGLDAGVRGTIRGIRRAVGRPYLGPHPVEAMEAAAQAAPAGSVLNKAANGDAKALREIAETSGMVKDPAIRGAISAMEADEAFAGVRTPGDEIGESQHLGNLAKAIRHVAGDPGAPPPGHGVAAPPAKPAPDLRDTAPVRLGETEMLEGKPVSFMAINPARILTDASTFQFKSEGDAAGVTARLRGVKRWDPLSAGKAFIFERKNGELVIADGHQRLGLARRLADQEPEPRLHAYIFREAAGWTPADVRAHAALKNMRELSGTSLDMARVMRERPDLVDDSLPLSDMKMREAVMLARLSDEAFGAVNVGRIPASFAALIGEHVPDPARHAGLLNEVAAADLANNTQARFYLAQLLELPTTTETQITLFGEEAITRSLMAERSRVLDAALKGLRSDKRIFGLLEREAGRIAEGGNVLDRQSNASRARNATELAELIEKLSTTHGVVALLLNDASIAVSRGLSAAQASRAFVRRIGDILDTEGLTGLVKAEAETQGAIARIDEPGGPEAKAQIDQLTTASDDDQGMMFAIRAFHGSPHDFDRFDISRIGTGEGAQAFGHGLYFAENELTAQAYQRQLAGPERYQLNGKDLPESVNAFALRNYARMKMEGNLSGLKMERARLEASIRMLQNQLEANEYDNVIFREVDQLDLRNNRSQLSDLDQIISGSVTRSQPGTLYEVEIDIEPEDLLDWDKPLGQQGEVGKKTLAVFERLDFTDNPKHTLSEIKKIVAEKHGHNAFNTITVSKLLRDAGIPGIRFLDQGSRDVGEGSRNIVIFDDSLVNVTRKNGKTVTGGERQDLIDHMFGLPFEVRQIMPSASGSRTGLSPRYIESAAAIRTEIDKVMNTVLPLDWRHVARDRLIYGGREVEGFADPYERIVYVSMAATDPAERAFEEAGHALRQAGLIPDADYAILRNEARRLGARKAFDIDERYGGLYGRRYQGNPERLEDALEEEAVMQMIAAHARGRSFGEPQKLVRRILDRLVKFFRAIREALAGRGFRRYEDVFQDIVSGRIAARQLGETERASDLVRMRNVMFAVGKESEGGGHRQGNIRDLINGELAEGRINREDADEMIARLDELEQHYRDNPAQAAEQLADEIDAEALHRQRLRRLSEAQQSQIEQFMLTYRDERGQADPARAMIALIEHHGLVQMPQGFSSATGREQAILGTVMARMEGLLSEFSRTRITGQTRNRARLSNVVRELFGEASGDETAGRLAQIWTEAADDLRQRYNAAGGAVGQLKDWGLPQSHNRLSLLRAGRERWIADITPQLDLERMRSPLTGNAMTADELRRSLDWIYREITSDGWHDREASMVRRGLGAVANQRGAHRFLIFKNADGWQNYQATYGAGGNPFVTMMNHLRGMARDIADMEVMGPNPRAMLTWMQQLVEKHAALRAAGQPALFPEITRLSGRRLAGDGGWQRIKNAQDYGRSMVKLAEDMYNIRRGHSGAAVNSRIAAVFDAIRNLQVGSLLGGATLSAITDIGFQRSARAFAGLPQTRILGDLLRENVSRSSRFEAVRAGLILDSALNVLQDQTRFFGGMQGPAWSRFIADRTLNWSLLQSWTQAAKHAWGKAVMVEFADHTGKAFVDLPERLRSMLERYGLDATDWDGLRLGAGGQPLRDLDMLTPMGVWEVRQAAGITDSLHERYLEMILQEGEYAVPVGSLQAQARSYGNLRRGVMLDEIRRSAMQFKMFPMTVMLTQGQRILAETLMRGAVVSAKIAAGILIGTTLLGALAIQLKEISRGKDPRPMNDARFWLAALAQGGGLGIFGDFLFAEQNRVGGGLAETVAGPTVGNVSQALRLTAGNLQRGIKGEKTSTGREAVRFLGQNTPFSSLWYLRLGYERLWLDTLQEQLDPEAKASFRRRLQNQRRNYGNEFFWRPGEVTPRRGPDPAAALGQ